MSNYIDLLRHELDSAREKLTNKVIAELERQLAPFFNKYPEAEAVLFSWDSRGDDEGSYWTQAYFEIVKDGDVVHEQAFNWEDEDDSIESIWISDMINEIPFDASDLIDLFGYCDLRFNNPTFKEADEDE